MGFEWVKIIKACFRDDLVFLQPLYQVDDLAPAKSSEPRAEFTIDRSMAVVLVLLFVMWFCGYSLRGLFNIWPVYCLITKTYLNNYDPLKPNFYIVKLGFTRVYIIFLFCSKT